MRCYLLSDSARSDLQLESDHAEAMQKIRYLEAKHHRTVEEEQVAPEAPLFGHPLKSLVLDEGQPAHFETTLTPVNDATMKVTDSPDGGDQGSVSSPCVCT
jgi:hypothetical protein